MSNKITIDIQEVKERKQQLLKEIKELDAIINYAEKFSNVNHTITKKTQKDDYKPTSKFAQAIELCEAYLQAGNTVHTQSEFMKYINSQGLELSRQGLALALSKSNIKYNRDKKTWELDTRE